MSQHDDIRDMFDGFKKLFEIMAQADAAKRLQRKENRKAKARARYARQKAAGTLPKRKKVTIEREPEYEHTSCYCQHTNPPCSYCTDKNWEE